MRRRLLASYLTLAVVALLLLEVPLAITYARNERNSMLGTLRHDAAVIAPLTEDVLQGDAGATSLRSAVAGYSGEANARLAVVGRAGGIVADPSGLVAASPALQAELAPALAGTAVSGSRGGLLFAAVPVVSDGEVHGAVLAAASTSEVDHRVNGYLLRLAGVAAAVLVLVALVGWLLARSVARPLKAVEAAAGQAGRGDLGARAPEHDGPPEVRSLARSFNDMIARLTQLLGAQEEFVADASHQLRTPLTALRLRLENDDTAGALTEVERLARLVDSLLALSRAEVSAPERVDLAAVVGERLEAWGPVAAERDVRVEGDVHGVALAGADRLGQVLDNLLANAIAVAPPGTAVTVSGDPAALHVRDRGPGLTEEERERAFDRFWSKGNGSGLGLAIVQRLLRADGASIELRSGGEPGLDVVVTLRTP